MTQIQEDKYSGDYFVARPERAQQSVVGESRERPKDAG
jgi:hypothetical protein